MEGEALSGRQKRDYITRVLGHIFFCTEKLSPRPPPMKAIKDLRSKLVSPTRPKTLSFSSDKSKDKLASERSASATLFYGFDSLRLRRASVNLGNGALKLKRQTNLCIHLPVTKRKIEGKEEWEEKLNRRISWMLPPPLSYRIIISVLCWSNLTTTLCTFCLIGFWCRLCPFPVYKLLIESQRWQPELSEPPPASATKYQQIGLVRLRKVSTKFHHDTCIVSSVIAPLLPTSSFAAFKPPIVCFRYNTNKHEKRFPQNFGELFILWSMTWFLAC